MWRAFHRHVRVAAASISSSSSSSSRNNSRNNSHNNNNSLRSSAAASVAFATASTALAVWSQSQSQSSSSSSSSSSFAAAEASQSTRGSSETVEDGRWAAVSEKERRHSSEARDNNESERGARVRLAAAAAAGGSASRDSASRTSSSTAPTRDKMQLTRRFTRRRQQRAHTFVIVGSGTAAHAAIEAIRQDAPSADILVLSDESARPRVDTGGGSGSGSGSGGRVDDSELGATGTHEPRQEQEQQQQQQIAEPLLETYNEWRRHLTATLEDEPSESGDRRNARVWGDGQQTQTQMQTHQVHQQQQQQHTQQQTHPQPAPPPLTLLLDKKEMRFDVEKNCIHLADGTEIRYEKCLIASPGKPRHFYVLDSDRISYSLKDRINLCTTLQDFAQLDQLHRRGVGVGVGVGGGGSGDTDNGNNRDRGVRSVTVIGGGFLGTEVATALATDPRNAHIKTRLVFTESAPTSRSLPFYLAQELTARLERVGVDVVADHLITSLKCGANATDNDDDNDNGNDNDNDAVGDTSDTSETAGVVIEGLGHGKKCVMHSDFVVLASTHTDPNLRFGRDTCFEFDDVNGGIVVNAQLEAISGLFVAGNAASYFDPYLGRRRVDRYDHAVNSGLVAGRNMVASLGPRASGKMKNYRHQPMFRSHLRGLDVVLEGIGEIDSSLRTVGVWVQPRGRPVHTSSSSSGGGGGGGDGHVTHARQSGRHSSSPPPSLSPLPSPPLTSFDRGVVYYLKGNKIMGILLWNASDVLDSAKQLMRSRPEIHGSVVEELQHAISIAPDDWLHVATT